MTRQEFIQNITDWYDLRDFCSENEYDFFDCVYDEDGRDTEIEYDISENIDYYAWKEIRDKLNGIPTNYEFYRKDEPFECV